MTCGQFGSFRFLYHSASSHVFGFSQTLITGTISRDVADNSGAAVPGATITVENLGTSLKGTATSTASGTFLIPDLAIGKYRVTATAEGFKTLNQTADVLTGAVTRTSFKLPVGQRTDTVEVEGSARRRLVPEQ